MFLLLRSMVDHYNGSTFPHIAHDDSIATPITFLL